MRSPPRAWGSPPSPARASGGRRQGCSGTAAGPGRAGSPPRGARVPRPPCRCARRGRRAPHAPRRCAARVRPACGGRLRPRPTCPACEGPWPAGAAPPRPSGPPSTIPSATAKAPPNRPGTPSARPCPIGPGAPGPRRSSACWRTRRRPGAVTRRAQRGTSFSWTTLDAGSATTMLTHAGPTSATKSAGTKQSTSGMVIFTLSTAARSSARCMRRIRMPSDWTRSARATLVPKMSVWLSVAASVFRSCTPVRSARRRKASVRRTPAFTSRKVSVSSSASTGRRGQSRATPAARRRRARAPPRRR